MENHTIKGLNSHLLTSIMHLIDKNDSGILVISSKHEGCAKRIMDLMSSYYIYANNFQSDNAAYQNARNDEKEFEMMVHHKSLFMRNDEDIRSFMKEIAIYNHVSKPIIFLYDSSHNYNIDLIQSVVDKGFFVVCEVNAPSMADALISIYPNNRTHLSNTCCDEALAKLSKTLLGIVFHDSYLINDYRSDAIDARLKDSLSNTPVFSITSSELMGVSISFEAENKRF